MVEHINLHNNDALETSLYKYTIILHCYGQSKELLYFLDSPDSQHVANSCVGYSEEKNCEKKCVL